MSSLSWEPPYATLPGALVQNTNAGLGAFENPYSVRDRQPMNSPPRIHLATGEWFCSTFGINYRSKALFCTGDLNVAKGYLKAHNALLEIQPVQPYSVCFSPTCRDLFGHFQFISLSDDEMQFLATIKASLESLNYQEYKNTGLEAAAASGNEVMVYAARFSFKQIRSGAA